MSSGEAWYQENEELHQLLAKRAENVLQTALSNEAIRYSIIRSRVKTFESFIEKMERMKYAKPREMTDLVGIMVVRFIPSDTKMLSGIVEGKFNVDWENTKDSSKELAEDRVGYRGKNYVVTLKEESRNNGENKNLGEIPFEIQIKTLLDYAWGEIEHDRNYKTAEELPRNSDIPRRFKLISGTLEILDNEFERLSQETERYVDTISNKISKGEIGDIPISPLSLRKFLTLNFRAVPGFKAYFIAVDDVLDELASSGIRTLADFNAIIPQNFKEKFAKASKPKDIVTFTTIIRCILIINDSGNYFSNAWKHHYNTFDYHFWKVFNEFEVDRTNFPSVNELEFDEGSDED